MTRRWREAFSLVLIGGVLGAVMVGLWYLFRPQSEGVTYSSRYVPVQGVEMSKAYASSLDVTFFHRGSTWGQVLGVGVAIGLAVGLIAFAVLVLTKRRISLVSRLTITG